MGLPQGRRHSAALLSRLLSMFVQRGPLRRRSAEVPGCPIRRTFWRNDLGGADQGLAGAAGDVSDCDGVRVM